jgi:hypothetical protein
VTEYFHQQNIPVLPWPAQSPNLNPIENVWSHIKAQLDRFQIIFKAMLRIKVQEIWQQINPNYLETLVKSMPKRMSDIIKRRGGAINY